jgi:hypothetical protein
VVAQGSRHAVDEALSNPVPALHRLRLRGAQFLVNHNSALSVTLVRFHSDDHFGQIILPKLPPPIKDPKEINKNLLRAATSVRRLGFLYIFGFVIAALGLWSGEYKEFPTWGVVLYVCMEWIPNLGLLPRCQMVQGQSHRREAEHPRRD